MQQSTKEQTLVLSNTGYGRKFWKSALEAIARSHTLQTLVISKEGYYERKFWISALEAIARSHTLQTLVLSHKDHYERNFWDMLCTSIANNGSIKHLGLVNLANYYLIHDDIKGVLEGALSKNRSIKSISIPVSRGGFVDVMKAVMVCPQIERLHAVNRHDGVHFWPNGVITGMTAFVREDEKLKELGIVNMCMDRAQTVEFASAFGENMTIKALTLGGDRCNFATWIFAEALPKKHSLKRITFYGGYPEEDYQVRIIEMLAQTRLQELFMVHCSSNRNHDILKACIRKLECTKNNFTNLILLPGNDGSVEADEIRMRVEKLTWCNFFQSEKDTWIDRFLKHGDSGNKTLVARAIERANVVDKRRHTKRPNILFSLIKEMSPKLLLGTSTNDKKQLTTRKRPRSEQ
jgi:hypothetical protein